MLGVGGGEAVHLAAELLAPKPGLVRRTAADAVQGLSQERKDAEHGKAFQCQQNLTAGGCLHLGKDGEIIGEQALVNHEGRRIHPSPIKAAGISAVETVGGTDLAHSSTTCQGRPCTFRASMKGSGSNSSKFHTPARFHRPWSIILAPIIAGTPVV